jgi:hypothetical protein
MGTVGGPTANAPKIQLCHEAVSRLEKPFVIMIIGTSVTMPTYPSMQNICTPTIHLVTGCCTSRLSKGVKSGSEQRTQTAGAATSEDWSSISHSSAGRWVERDLQQDPDPSGRICTDDAEG